MRSWLGDRFRNTSSFSLDSLDEPQTLEDALHAASYIMHDDMEMAESELSKGNSAFHKLGLGLVSFMRAILGFERELMAEAQERLVEAENLSYESYRRAQRYPSASQTVAYSPGTEYLLCQAQVQIMSAVVGVLTENITEAMRAFYKLRKAYITLDAILAEEQKYLKSLEDKTTDKATPGIAGASTESSTSSITNSHYESGGNRNVNGVTGENDSGSEEFFDITEDYNELANMETPQGEKGIAEALEKAKLEDDLEKPELLRRLSSQIQEGPDTEVFTNFVDSFIHSSSNMCYGMLLILISMLPPAFSTLSRIVGFKGDRKRGISLLWQASKFGNLNGAFAGLVLLGYYNGFIGFCDILPLSGSGAYPKERCKALLQTFRQRYPKSGLWMLEESRMISSDKNLRQALDMLKSMPSSNLKQIMALQCFEKSMNAMYLHRYEDCSETFQKMVGLNNWSHGLYYYLAACAHVERYRELLSSDPKRAAAQKEKAVKIFKIVPDHLGKKKIMARQLPFDVFVGRKLQKWQQRADDHNLDFVDAVGVSPIEEMIYFWNGFKKMPSDRLEESLEKLTWSESTGKIPWTEDTVDEHAIQAVLKATILRNLGRTEEARDIMEKKILSKDKSMFKGGLKDNWTCPVAHYEMGVNYWFDYHKSSKQSDLSSCIEWLDKAAAWESYDLDARVGMRVKTGQVTAKKMQENSS